MTKPTDDSGREAGQTAAAHRNSAGRPRFGIEMRCSFGANNHILLPSQVHEVHGSLSHALMTSRTN